MKYTLVFICQCFILNLLTGQNFENFQNNYEPFAVSSEKSTKLIQELTAKYEKDIKSIEERENAKYHLESYERRFNNIKNDIEGGAIITEASVTEYFNNILDEILNANPDIRKDKIRLLVYRSETPNASCHGEGTIYFNIGLMNRLENESQVAFVIAHELAHYIKNHVNIAMSRSVNKLYSKETEAELKKIQKEEYSKITKANELFKGYVYDSRKHSRLNEEQADEVAIRYLLSTKYDAREAIATLEILDKVEWFKYNHKINWRRFDFETFPFKTKWTTPESLLSFQPSESEVEKQEAELLKTHPDCPIRIQAAKTLLAQYDTTNKMLSMQTKAVFKRIVTACDFEIIQQAYDFNQLDIALFYTLQMLEKYPNNAYLHAMVGKIFYVFFRARNDHKSFDYVPKPNSNSNSDLDSNYNEVLIFFNNIRTSEVAKLAYHYMSQQDGALLKNEEFYYAYALSVMMNGNSEELAKVKLKFENAFPSGKRLAAIQKLQVLSK
jgi:predicted Zn-dependent protease